MSDAFQQASESEIIDLLNRIKNIAVVGLHWGAYQKFEPERVPEVFDALD